MSRNVEELLREGIDRLAATTATTAHRHRTPGLRPPCSTEPASTTAAGARPSPARSPRGPPP